MTDIDTRSIAYEAVAMAGRLTEARTVLGLTQADVAGALGIPRTAVSDIENGKRKLYALELRRLSRLYRRPVAWLTGEVADPPSSGELTAALAGLTEHDRDAVLSYARFLAHQASRGRGVAR